MLKQLIFALNLVRSALGKSNVCDSTLCFVRWIFSLRTTVWLGESETS
ncbi:hypothetical protein [Bernardetia sp. MNP-M8]